MGVVDIPTQLEEICSLEERLISLKIPFMKIISLPTGRQRAVHGAVVNVPPSLKNVVEQLPRLPSETGIIPVKLKRRLIYKGHILYQNIRPQKIMEALHWLVENNQYYADINITNCIEDLPEDNTVASLIESELLHDDDETDMIVRDNNIKSSESEDDIEGDDNNENLELRGLPFDTCLQDENGPASAKDILNVAPAEGNTPISIFSDSLCEVQSFPSLFPDGNFGFNHERQKKTKCKKILLCPFDQQRQ